MTSIKYIKTQPREAILCPVLSLSYNLFIHRFFHLLKKWGTKLLSADTIHIKSTVIFSFFFFLPIKDTYFVDETPK